MKISIKILSFFVFALLLSLMACKGENGAIGPVGPAGAVGADGQDGVDGTDGADGQDGAVGAKGEKGDKGDDGNANVFASDWYDINFSNTSGTFGIHYQPAPEITDDAMENAVILGYIRLPGSALYLLPIQWSSSNDATIKMEVVTGEFRTWYTATSTFNTPTLIGRYVIIPSTGRLAAPEGVNPKLHIMDQLELNNVDINDYDQVAKFLEIEAFQ